MAQIDHRKDPNTDLSFYVLDDLRFQQNREISDRTSFDLYRFDTLSEAIGKLREIPAYMTPALGMQRGTGELDLVHRREGEYNLVTDYQNLPAWRNDSHVLDAVRQVCETLVIEWQLHNGPFNSSVLIPLDLEDLTEGFLPDTYFFDKDLRAELPAFWDKASPNTAINEVFAPGKGWLDYQSARKLAEQFGYANPHCLKVTRFNVNYAETANPRKTGQADISPKDLRLLMEKWHIREGNSYESLRATQRLADELSECVYGYQENPIDRQKHFSSFVDDLYKGNYENIDRVLTKAPANTTLELNKIYELRYRIAGLASKERKPSLEETIQIAADQREIPQTSSREPEQIR